MTSHIFRQTLFISILGHVAAFSIFSFSFGPKIPEVNFAGVSFRGAILRSSDLMNTRNFSDRQKTQAVVRNPQGLMLDKINQKEPLLFKDYLKPQMILTSQKDRMFFVEKTTLRVISLKRKEPTIMFYPKLPYQFALYFKDRQVAHIELMFAAVASGPISSIAIKRKISSGNLEADLLSMRYIGHYLFIQQAGFAPNSWQTVKVELTRLND